MLEPRLARALVNLSRPVVGGVLLDPFSGTGGVLLEGEVVGCLPVGVDLDWRMARGALRNVSWAGSIGGIIRGDARALPVGRADCAASDLPYGRMSSSHGSSTEELLSSVVGQLPRILRTGGTPRSWSGSACVRPPPREWSSWKHIYTGCTTRSPGRSWSTG
jgi:Predicted DNA modification methylase